MDPIAELQSIFGRDPIEPLLDSVGTFLPEIMEYESPLGTYYDAFPLMEIRRPPRPSGRWFEAVPDSVIDVRRFRPSLIASDTMTAVRRDGQVEPRSTASAASWSPAIDDGPGDRAILRHIVADLDQIVGVRSDPMDRHGPRLTRSRWTASVLPVLILAIIARNACRHWLAQLVSAWGLANASR